MRRSLVAAALFLAPSVAGAEAVVDIKVQGAAGYYDFVATDPSMDDLRFARQVLPPSPPRTHAIAQSRIIYLNKNGVTVSPGANNSRTNRSTIAQQQTTVAPWQVSATIWNATVACVRELFAPFGATVVDTDPGNVPHIEAVFGGSPTQFGMSQNVAGVSPFTENCAIIENAIVYTFTDVIPDNARQACEIQAQEIAHAFGLDHELLASDPMTYLPYQGNRSFKNEMASCGENTARPCGINGSTCRNGQNSVALLTERLGPAGNPGDTTPPTLNITSPQPNAVVPPGFEINFTADDNINVQQATLFVDDEQIGSLLGDETLKFKTPADLAEGGHTFRIEVTDGTNTQIDEINLTIRKGAPLPGAEGFDSSDITGGCSSSKGSASLLFALGFVAMLLRRRRR